MFLKKCKKAIILLMTMLTVANTVSAEFYDVPAELASYGQQIYSSARGYFGRGSFSGYCGTYVKCQLRAMGIFENQFDLHGNGNQWYSNFANVNQTSGGYHVYRESGSDCLQKLAEKYGDNLSNIVLSFPVQAGYSAAYPGAGHAFVIYEIRDNIAYYSESFRLAGFREGQVIAEDVDSLLKRYSRRHGALTGCVMLSKEAMTPRMTDAEQAVILAEVLESLESLSDITFIASEFTQISQSRVMA